MWERLYQLFREQWRTSVETETDADGWIRFRGFTGSYRLLLDRAAGASGYAVELPPSGSTPEEKEQVLAFR